MFLYVNSLKFINFGYIFFSPMENFKKSKHLISTCNSLIKAFTFDTLYRFTGDTASTAYWRIRNGKGLLTFADKESLNTWNGMITKVRRFMTSPLPLEGDYHGLLVHKREQVLERMEAYRDWLEYGSDPVYLTSLSSYPDYASYSLEMAMNILLSDMGLPQEDLFALDKETLNERLRDLMTVLDVTRLLEYDRLISSEIHKMVMDGDDVRQAVRILMGNGRKLLPLDQIWHIRTDIEHRSSRGANINGTLDWIYHVEDKSTDHKKIYLTDNFIIDSYKAWKVMKKETFMLEKKNKRGLKVDSPLLLEEILAYLNKIIIPEFTPIVKVVE